MGVLKDEMLVKVSAILSVVFFLSALYLYEEWTTKIANINERYIGRSVCIEGKIVKKWRAGNACYLYFVRDETASIRAFVCNYSKIFNSLSEIDIGEKVKICGKIEKYRNYLEIIPFSVKKL